MKHTLISLWEVKGHLWVQNMGENMGLTKRVKLG